MEKSCGIVLFNSDEVLLIQHPTGSNNIPGHWDFPKGHIEKNETEIETASRELFEETGIQDFELIDNFRYKISYDVFREGKKTPKEVIFFMAKCNTKNVKLSDEHHDYCWLDFDSAYDLLTYDNAKQVFRKTQSLL